MNLVLVMPAGIDSGMTLSVGAVAEPTKDRPGAELFVEVRLLS